MTTEIKTSTDSIWVVDEDLTLDVIQQRIPGFFSESNTRFFGDQPPYRVYRGQLIVHSETELSDHSPYHKINVYLCGNCTKGPDKGRGFDTLHAGWPSDDEEAKLLIDYILETGQYYYGIEPPNGWHGPKKIKARYGGGSRWPPWE